MRDLPSDERERALHAVATAAILRGKGGFSEEEIADKAGFEEIALTPTYGYYSLVTGRKR